jgi:hypothetical protein
MPLASTETAIASTVKFTTGSSISQEIQPKPTPSPTLNNDDLCAAAAREVQGSRILIDAQAKTIDALDKQAAALLDKIRAQNELLDVYRQANQASIDIQKKYDDIVVNKDKQIANLEKEVEVLKNKKPNLMTRIGDILLGVGVGILLH